MNHLSTTERFVYVKASIPREVYESLLERYKGHVPYLLRDLRLQWEQVLTRETIKRLP